MATSPMPTSKVTAATLGGAIASLAAWAVQALGGVDVPPGIEAAVATLVAFAAGYLVRETRPSGG